MTDRASPVERVEAARRAQEQEEERAAYRVSVAAVCRQPGCGFRPVWGSTGCAQHQVGATELPRKEDHWGAVSGEDEIAWRRSIRRCLVWICAGIWFAIISAHVGALIWVVWAATRQGG